MNPEVKFDRSPVILIIDNYDSFTYNLVQAIGIMNGVGEIKVIMNDQMTIAQIKTLQPAHILISPGPCTPNEAGISLEVIESFAGKVPILGVCLGHQCIGQVFGAKVVRAGRLMHGKVSPIHHCGTGIYDGVPDPFIAARYHSLILDQSTIPPGFEATAWTDHDELMGIRNTSLALEGVQFHPESFLTPQGSLLLKNFVGATATVQGPVGASAEAGRQHRQAVAQHRHG